MWIFFGLFFLSLLSVTAATAAVVVYLLFCIFFFFFISFVVLVVACLLAFVHFLNISLDFRQFNLFWLKLQPLPYHKFVVMEFHFSDSESTTTTTTKTSNRKNQLFNDLYRNRFSYNFSLMKCKRQQKRLKRFCSWMGMVK